MATRRGKVISRATWEKMLKVVDIRNEDMNNLMLNFLATECYEKAAENFINESGTELVGTDLEGVRARADIKRKILRGEICGALNSLQAYSPLAFQRDAVLYHLCQQIMIELIGDGEVETALNFGQKFLSDGLCRHDDIEKVCGLLVFEDPFDCPLAELLGASQRLKTAKVVNKAILNTEHQEAEPKLEKMLKVLVLVQDEINKMAAYPKINISSGILEDPVI